MDDFSWLYQTVEVTCGKLPWRNIEDMDDVGKFKKVILPYFITLQHSAWDTFYN